MRVPRGLACYHALELASRREEPRGGGKRRAGGRNDEDHGGGGGGGGGRENGRCVRACIEYIYVRHTPSLGEEEEKDGRLRPGHAGVGE